MLSAAGVAGVLTTVAQALVNRKMNKATANNTEADYTKKIIEQSDARAAQYKEDANLFRKERDEAREESKGQRKAKQEWRDRFYESEKARHALELELSDERAKRAEERWHRCEVNGCNDRMPPRSRENDGK